MGRCHITRGNGPPTSAPLATGDHYNDETNGITYLSKGTASVADWVIVADSSSTLTALQGQITSNDTDITAIQTEQTIQNTDIQDNITDIAANATDIAANATDITTIQTEQTTQNTTIAANMAAHVANAAVTAANQTAINNHVVDLNNPHQTSFLNLSDVLDSTYAGGNVYFRIRTNAAGTGIELWQDYEVSAIRTDPLLHQPNTFFQYLTLNADIPVAGDYILFMSHRVSLNATNVNFESHVLHNGDFFIPTHYEPQDSFGAGIVVANSTGGTTNTGTDNFQTFSGMVTFAGLPTGPQTFILEFRGQTANQEATVYEAEMFLKRKAD